MNLDRIISVFVGSLFFLFGLVVSCLIVYDQGPWFIRQFTWTSATAIVDDIEGGAGESVLVLTIEDEDGTSRVIRKEYYIDEEDDIYIGKSLSAIYNPADKSQVHVYDHVWWGFLAALAFMLFFVVLGYYLVSLKAQQRFRQWNHDWRFYWALFVVAGLATLAMAIDPAEPSADSVIQSEWGIRFIFILIGSPLLLMGSYGLYKIYQKSQVRG